MQRRGIQTAFALFLILPAFLLAEEESETGDLARLEMAYNYLLAGNVTLARPLLEGLEAGPFADVSRLELARLGVTDKKDLAAIQEQIQGIKNDEIRARASLALVRALADQNRSGEALGIAMQLALSDSSPSSDAARLLCAEIYFNDGEYKASEAQLLQLLENKRSGQRAAGTLLLARIYLAAGPLRSVARAEALLRLFTDAGAPFASSGLKAQARRLRAAHSMPL